MYVGRLEASAHRVAVPACPGWSVADVLAHLAGAASDVVAGRIEGVGTPTWTAAQVDQRRRLDIPELIDEWSQSGPAFEALLAGLPPEIAGMALGDLITHEHDIRSALGDSGGRDTPAYETALQYQVAGLGARLDGAGLPGLRLVAGKQEWVVGARSPGASVEGDRHDVLRTLSSRRNAERVRAMNWEGTPDIYLAVLGAYGPLPVTGDEQ